MRLPAATPHVALAAALLVAAVGAGYLAAPLVLDCGSDGLDYVLAGETTVEATPGSETPGEVTVTFTDDGRTHPLHPCDARGGDAPVDRFRIEWEAVDGGNVSVVEGSAILAAEGDRLVLKEEEAATDTTVRLLILARTAEGSWTARRRLEVTL